MVWRRKKIRSVGCPRSQGMREFLNEEMARLPTIVGQARGEGRSDLKVIVTLTRGAPAERSEAKPQWNAQEGIMHSTRGGSPCESQTLSKPAQTLSHQLQGESHPSQYSNFKYLSSNFQQSFTTN